MDDTAWDIAEFEEEGFGEMAKDRAERFIEVERPSVIAAVIDPDEHPATVFEDLWQGGEAMLRLREMMKDTDGIGDIKSILKRHGINVGLDDTDIGERVGHLVGDFDTFSEIGTERDLCSGKSCPFGETPGSAPDIKRCLVCEARFLEEWGKKMEKVVLFVVVFPVDIFPLVGEALSGLFLVL